MKPFILILSLLFVVGCSDDDNNAFEARTIDATEIAKGALYGNGEEGITASGLVINSTADWQSLVAQMNTVNNVSDEFYETDIDFDAFTVLALFLEIKGNGWEVAISEITENESDIVVSKTETEAVNSVITQPFCIVKIPKTNKPIVFE